MKPSVCADTASGLFTRREEADSARQLTKPRTSIAEVISAITGHTIRMTRSTTSAVREESMIDKETYKKELKRMFDSLSGGNKSTDRCGIKCSQCPLKKICNNNIYAFDIIEAVEKWSKEHPQKKYKVSKLEYYILKYLSDNTIHMYIERDEDSNIYLFDEKPRKIGGCWYGRGAHLMAPFNKLFQFIQWGDEEATSIKEVLENCEVDA